MKWLKISVETDPFAEEIVSELMISAGAQGVHLEGGDPAALGGLPGDYLDEALKEASRFCVSAYFPRNGEETGARERIEAKLGRVRAMGIDFDLGSLAVFEEEIDEEDWENAWKVYFKPEKMSDFLVVKPSWEEYTPLEDEIVVEIDPGMAFGTGTHETTRMCAMLLEEFVEPGALVLDVGCGSGILAVAAAKLGAGRVRALDMDGVAVGIAGQNAARNGCKNIEVLQSDLLAALSGEEKADLVVANIVADVILRLAPDVPRHLKHNGMFLCSGIIDSRLEEVEEELKRHTFRIINVLESGEWRAIACKYKG